MSELLKRKKELGDLNVTPINVKKKEKRTQAMHSASKNHNNNPNDNNNQAHQRQKKKQIVTMSLQQWMGPDGPETREEEQAFPIELMLYYSLTIFISWLSSFAT